MALEASRNKCKKGGEEFLEGTRVEVCSKEEGFLDSWYVAKILKSPSSSSKNYKSPKGIAIVEYETLVCEDNDKKLLTEKVDGALIRPLPPAIKLRSFEKFDVVDAYSHDGWWKGVVTEVIDFEDEEKKEKCKKYIVAFEDPPERTEFEASSLRFHLDWVRGAWVQPEKQKRMQWSKFSKRMEVEVNLGEENQSDDWFPAVVLEEVGFDSFLVKLRNSRSEDKNGLKKATVDCFHIRPPLPISVLANFEPLEQVYAFYDSAWRAGLITEIHSEKRYTVLLKHSKEEKKFSHSNIRPRMHFQDGTWISSSEDPENRANGQQFCSHTDNNSERTKVAAQLECSSSTKERLKENTMQTAQLDSAPELSYPCKKMKMDNSPESCVNSMLNQKPNQVGAIISTLTKCSNHHLVSSEHSSENENHFEEANQEGAATVNSMEEGPTPPGHVSEKANTEGDFDGHVVEEQNTKNIDSSDVIAEESRGLAVENSFQLCNEMQEIDLQQNIVEDAIMKSVEEQEKSQNSPVKSHLFPSIGVVTQESNQEESRHLGEIMISMEELGIPTDAQGQNQLVPTAGEDHNVAGEGAANMETEDSSATEVVEFPFEKISPLWEMLESLQVFQTIPQKPHFRPLFSYKKLDREGYAIAQMVKFSNLVEKMKKLQFDTSHDAFNSYLEALDELKIHGFDVEAVERHLNELLSIKKRRAQLEDQSKKLQTQIADCTLEGTKLDEDISASEKMISELLSQIHELEEKVHEVEKKKAVDMSVKETKDSQITELRNESNAINENIANAIHDFDRLATASIVTGIVLSRHH